MPRFKDYKTIPQQVQCIHDLFPSFKHSINVKSKTVTWRGVLQPTPKSVEYEIFIKYKLLENPKVWIKSPEIDLNCKHIYPQDNSLCLYYPHDKEWTEKNYIGETIIPWTAEWLRFYEIWQKTGIWFGEEAPHSSNK